MWNSSASSTSSTNYTWYVDDFKYSCEDCELQYPDGRVGIQQKGFERLLFDDVYNNCKECYSWNNISEKRKNYKVIKYSRKKIENFLNDVFG